MIIIFYPSLSRIIIIKIFFVSFFLLQVFLVRVSFAVSTSSLLLFIFFLLLLNEMVNGTRCTKPNSKMKGIEENEDTITWFVYFDLHLRVCLKCLCTGNWSFRMETRYLLSKLYFIWMNGRWSRCVLMLWKHNHPKSQFLFVDSFCSNLLILYFFSYSTLFE